MIKQGIARKLGFFQRYCSQFSTLAPPPKKNTPPPATPRSANHFDAV